MLLKIDLFILMQQHTFRRIFLRRIAEKSPSVLFKLSNSAVTIRGSAKACSTFSFSKSELTREISLPHACAVALKFHNEQRIKKMIGYFIMKNLKDGSEKKIGFHHPAMETDFST